MVEQVCKIHNYIFMVISVKWVKLFSWTVIFEWSFWHFSCFTM